MPEDIIFPLAEPIKLLQAYRLETGTMKKATAYATSDILGIILVNDG